MKDLIINHFYIFGILAILAYALAVKGQVKRMKAVAAGTMNPFDGMAKTFILSATGTLSLIMFIVTLIIFLVK